MRELSERVMNGTNPFKLMLAAWCSTAERFILLGVPQSWTAQSIMFFFHFASQRTCIFKVTLLHNVFRNPPQIVFLLPHLVFTLKSRAAVQSGGDCGRLSGPRATRGRGSWPNRRCWKARRKSGRKPGSRNPTRWCWRGSVLSSSRLLYTLRSSRRSSCSLSRPGTRTCSCRHSRAKRESFPSASWAEGCDPCWKMNRPV